MISVIVMKRQQRQAKETAHGEAFAGDVSIRDFFTKDRRFAAPPEG